MYVGKRCYVAVVVPLCVCLVTPLVTSPFFAVLRFSLFFLRCAGGGGGGSDSDVEDDEYDTHPKTISNRFYGKKTPSKSPKRKRLNSIAWQYIKRLRDVRGAMEAAGYSEASIIKVRCIVFFMPVKYVCYSGALTLHSLSLALACACARLHSLSLALLCACSISTICYFDYFELEN